MEDPRVDFNNKVWELLNSQSDEVIKEFIKIMLDINEQYIYFGGQYPTPEFVLGMATDNIKQIQKQEKLEENESESEEENLTPQQKKEKVRQSWLNKFG